jgi:hypothetical protein
LCPRENRHNRLLLTKKKKPKAIISFDTNCFSLHRKDVSIYSAFVPARGVCPAAAHRGSVSDFGGKGGGQRGLVVGQVSIVEPEKNQGKKAWGVGVDRE